LGREAPAGVLTREEVERDDKPLRPGKRNNRREVVHLVDDAMADLDATHDSVQGVDEAAEENFLVASAGSW
jgi:hypothetical protein